MSPSPALPRWERELEMQKPNRTTLLSFDVKIQGNPGNPEAKKKILFLCFAQPVYPFCNDIIYCKIKLIM